MALTYVAGYCRVSTDHTDQANSFSSQQRFFREYIQNHPEWVLHEIYADEGITGTSTQKRIQFNRMIQDAEKGKFQLIITKEVSRFSRNILDTIQYTRQLRKCEIGVLFLTDGINTLDPDAELRLSIMASIAQEESRRTSARVVWGQTRQMERGVVFGRSLLGYDVKDGKMSINPEGAEVIRLIFRKYGLEQTSTTQIARYLTESGYQTSRGNTNWQSNTIVKILHNEKYVGDLIQKKTYTPDYLTHEKRRNNGAVPTIVLRDHHTPIISRELWDLVQHRLQKNDKHRKNENGHSNRYIFSGKIRCGQCGSSFVGRFRYQKDGSKIRRWSCATTVRGGTAACSTGKLVRDDDAMLMLKTAVKSLPMDSEDMLRKIVSIAHDAIRSEDREASDTPEHRMKEMNKILQKKDRLLDCFCAGEVSATDMQRMLKKYDTEMEALQRRSEAWKKDKYQKTNDAVLRSKIEKELKRILSGETESEVFCKNILHSLTVYPDRHMELRLNHLPQVFHFTG